MNENELNEILLKIKNRDWKNKNDKYLFELQKFLDKASNIKDEELRLSIIYQMIKCDNILTEICEEILNKKYNV